MGDFEGIDAVFQVFLFPDGSSIRIRMEQEKDLRTDGERVLLVIK